MATWARGRDYRCRLLLILSMALRRHMVSTCSMHWWRMGKVMPGKGDVAVAVAGHLERGGT